MHNYGSLFWRKISNLDSQSIMDRNRIFWSHYLGLRISWDDCLFLSRITSIHNTLARISEFPPYIPNKQTEHGTSVGICTCTYSSMHLSTLQVCLVGRVAGNEGRKDGERASGREGGREREREGGNNIHTLFAYTMYVYVYLHKHSKFQTISPAVGIDL